MDALGQAAVDWQRAAASKQRAERVVALTKVARAVAADGAEAAMLRTDLAWACCRPAAMTAVPDDRLSLSST
eukprot:9484057-Alexandrium_andersonii.AAC.1